MEDEILKTPITGAALWGPEDFPGDDWVWRITDEELADIHNAFLNAQSRRLRLGEFGKEDFPLPVFGKKLEEIRQALIEGVRFALIRKLPVDRYSVSELEVIYWGIGTHLGSGIGQNASGSLLTHVTHRGIDPSNPNVRGYQDRRHQEPHNDLADIVGLLCVRKAKSGGASSIVNIPAVYNEFLANRPELLKIFYRGFHLDYRGEGDDPNATTDYRVPNFGVADGNLSVFFGRRGIEAALRKRGETATVEETEAMDYLEDLLNRPEYRLDMQLETGDIQFVNNYAVMHARTAYEDYEEPERWRLMLRLWLNLEDIQLPPRQARFTRAGFADVATKDK
ncbi:TauD/TfdA family dioxygenase [uncultured Parasphingorhabdus sp.]|uniref:TauD/TfdA family dioxygenase n=1 Tax=uncultured Parasphingorhabdus sp. TaxID=2709694 RepID=UPI0030D97ADD|tara:strand:+ start:10233 stop:11243 length:1011 start_codon:yes stop_codon:yes gene_type:complete